MENNKQILESFWKLEKDISESINKIDLKAIGIEEPVGIQQFFGDLNISAHIYSEPVIFQSSVPLIVLRGDSGRMYFFSFYVLFPQLREKHVRLSKELKEEQEKEKLTKEKKDKEIEKKVNRLWW